MNETVRHVGHMVEWSCPSCGAVLQGTRAAGEMCGACGGLTQRIAELHRALVGAEREAERLAQDNNEQLDTIESLRNAQLVAGLSEQSRRALERAQEYLDEGDDVETSLRLREALLQAVACAASAAKAAA